MIVRGFVESGRQRRGGLRGDCRRKHLWLCFSQCTAEAQEEGCLAQAQEPLPPPREFWAFDFGLSIALVVYHGSSHSFRHVGATLVVALGQARGLPLQRPSKIL